ncbi:MAG TPA: EAL domain-containing protein [Kineosporiaceae bacterium]|nr:EAL domain-containing protein [Kineosporiaceae bacterium]
MGSSSRQAARHRAADQLGEPTSVPAEVDERRRPLIRAAWIAGVLLVLDALLSLSGVLSTSASQVVDDFGQLLAGGFAAGCCLWTWRRSQPPDRLWRLLLGLGATGWTCGQALWTYYQVIKGNELPSPSLADVGYFTLPLFALPALWIFPAQVWPPGPGTATRVGQLASRPFTRLVIILDSLVAVGSLFLLTWATSLGAALNSSAVAVPDFLVALAYPVSDLVLVVFVVLLGRFRMPSNPGALALFGLGVISISVSDGFFLYLVSTDASEMPPLYNLGFLLGPVLLGLGALFPAPVRTQTAHQRRSTERGLVLLPYLPLSATGLLVTGQLLTSSRIDVAEAVIGLSLVALVVLRQFITLLDNSRLVRELRESQHLLREQAFNDSLTGLANRALFRDRLDHAVDTHRADRRSLGLIFCDLDDFKLINDGMGHAAGDELLRAVAQRLRACVQVTDTVARLGGDEFAVLLEGSGETPELIGERILLALSQPFVLRDLQHTEGSAREGTSVRVGASIGAAVMDPREPAITPDGLMARVDAAMYAAKRRGKSQLVAFRGDVTDDSSPGLIGDLRVLLAAQRADPLMRAGGSIDVMYQPVVRLDTEETVALEALVRWQHPRHGLLPAEVLLAAAEDAGMLGALEEQVLDTACRDISTLRRYPGLNRLTVHVNLSAQRTGDPRLVGSIKEMLIRHGLPGQALVLEITETGKVPDLKIAAQILTQIRGLDVRLALDDFGSGFSGLNYLLKLPIDIVKLDRSLTTSAPGSRGSAIRNAAATLILGLGVELIAEGVEKSTQVAELIELGCHLGQGFLYSKPRFLADLELAGPYLAG